MASAAPDVQELSSALRVGELQLAIMSERKLQCVTVETREYLMILQHGCQHQHLRHVTCFLARLSLYLFSLVAPPHCQAT